MPGEYKVLSGVISSLFNLKIFIVVKTFPSLLANLSPHGTYWLLGSICLASNFFYYFFMPETKGKTALEVKQIFVQNK